MDNKGQGIPLNVIVVAALALLALVIVGAFFLSGSSGTFAKFGEATTQQSAVASGTAISSCKAICSNAKTQAKLWGDDALACNAYKEGWASNDCTNQIGSDCTIASGCTLDDCTSC